LFGFGFDEILKLTPARTTFYDSDHNQLCIYLFFEEQFVPAGKLQWKIINALMV